MTQKMSLIRVQMEYMTLKTRENSLNEDILYGVWRVLEKNQGSDGNKLAEKRAAGLRLSACGLPGSDSIVPR